MRFGRSIAPDPLGTPPTPGERLVRRTGLGLALFTLALIAILMASVGFVTAAATLQTANQSVDRNLRAAAANMIESLKASPTPSGSASPDGSAEPTASPEETDDDDSGDDDDDDSGSGSDNSGSGSDNSGPGSDNSGPGSSDDDDRTPRPTRRPRTTALPTPTPTSRPSPAPTAVAEDRSIESADTFFLVLDSTGRVAANPQRVPLTGLPDAEAFGVALSGRQDWRTIRAGGRPIRIFSQPIEEPDGTISGVLQSGFVLTFQEEQTADLVRTVLLTMLVGLIGAALVTLIVTRRAMSPVRAAFESERRFVAAASHELRTPVAVVRASAEILQREDLVKPEGRKLVEDVVSESDRMGRLVGDMLALASAEAGQIAINATTFDLRELVEEVVVRVAGISSDRGVRVESVQEAGDEELWVSADRERMHQLLLIFIDNAIDHSPPHGVVRVVCRPVSDGNRARAVVDVLDQGPGVPLQERDRIFEPFAKVGGRRRTTGSTGLGLAIARILAERQQATISVRDAPGGGAWFSVSLVRVPPATAPSSSRPG